MEKKTQQITPIERNIRIQKCNQIAQNTGRQFVAALQEKMLLMIGGIDQKVDAQIVDQVIEDYKKSLKEMQSHLQPSNKMSKKGNTYFQKDSHDKKYSKRSFLISQVQSKIKQKYRSIVQMIQKDLNEKYSKNQIVQEKKHLHFLKFQIDQFEHEKIQTIPGHQSKKFRVIKMEAFEEIESLKQKVQNQKVQNQKDNKSQRKIQKMEEQQVKIFDNLREKINGFEQNYHLETYSTKQECQKQSQIVSLIEEIQKSQKYLKNTDLYGLKIQFYNIIERPKNVKKTIEDSKNNLGYFDDHFLKLNTNAKIHLEHKNYMLALIHYLQILSIQRDLGLFYIGVCFQKMNWNYTSIKCLEKACEIRKDPLYYLKLLEGYNRLRSLNSSDLQEEEKQENQKLINVLFKIIGEKINIKYTSRINFIILKNIFYEKDELNVSSQLSDNKILNKKAKVILLDLSQNYRYDESTSTKDTEISKFLQINDIDQLYQNTKTQFKQSLKQSYSWKTFSHFSLQEKSYKQLLISFQLCFKNLKWFEITKKQQHKIIQDQLDYLLDQFLSKYDLQKHQNIEEKQQEQPTIFKSFILKKINIIQKRYQSFQKLKEQYQHSISLTKWFMNLKNKLTNIIYFLFSIKQLKERIQFARLNSKLYKPDYKLNLAESLKGLLSQEDIKIAESYNSQKFENQMQQKIKRQECSLQRLVQKWQAQLLEKKFIKEVETMSKKSFASRQNIILEECEIDTTQKLQCAGQALEQLTLFGKTIQLYKHKTFYMEMAIVDPGLDLIDQERLDLHIENCLYDNCESDSSLVVYFNLLNFFLLQKLISEKMLKGKDIEGLNKYVSYLTAFQSTKYKVSIGNLLPKVLMLISGHHFQKFLAQTPKILKEKQFQKIKQQLMQKCLNLKKLSKSEQFDQKDAKINSLAKEIQLKGQFASLNSIYKKMHQNFENQHLEIDDLPKIFDLESLKPEQRIPNGIIIVQITKCLKEYIKKIVLRKYFYNK